MLNDEGDEREKAMRGGHAPIHPELASRSRRVWLGPLTVLACLAGFGLAGTAVFGWPPVPGLPAAGAQASDRTDIGKGGRVAPARTQAAGAAVGQPRELRNSISRQASEWGITTCLPHIVTLSDFLTSNRNFSALSHRAGGDGDASSFAATIAALDGSGLASISTFHSAPVAENECRSAYQTVAAFASRCELVRATLFAGFGDRIEFGGHVEAWHDTRGTYVYFLPLAETACAIVKTQMIR